MLKQIYLSGKNSYEFVCACDCVQHIYRLHLKKNRIPQGSSVLENLLVAKAIDGAELLKATIAFNHMTW